MRNSQFIKTMLRLQNVPRWDEFAPRFSDNSASHSYRSASFALLAVLKEKKLGNPIDDFKTVARALLQNMNKTITGSIKHETKKDPDIRDLIKMLEKDASEKIVDYLMPSMKKHFYDFLVNAEDDSYEGKLVEGIATFDAMIFCYREAEVDESPFFIKRYENFRQELMSHEIPSVRWLVEEFNKKEGIHEFIMSIMKMDTIRRWKGKQNLIHDDDAIHTFRATVLSVFNGLYEREEFGKIHINMFSVTGRTIFHDLVESITGDILGPVKHATPETKRAFELYEQKVAKRMMSWLPGWMQNDMHQFVVNAKDDTYDGKLVGASDKIDALIKAKMEKEINSKEYEETYYKQLNSIKDSYTNESVDFFMEYILKAI